jgi:hypothetical protein
MHLYIGIYIVRDRKRENNIVLFGLTERTTGGRRRKENARE